MGASVAIERSAAALRLFLKECRGNVAVTFAVAAFPVMLAAGAAVDYSAARCLGKHL